MKFNSQICTTREQSERLLSLGLKKETADMTHLYSHSTDSYELRNIEFSRIMHLQELANKKPVLGVSGDELYAKDIPAWSLHRLIEIMPRCIKCRNGHDYADLYVNYDLVQYRFYDTDYMHDVCYEHFNDGDVYSNVIDCIEWLIKEGYFNKEYLEE
jgi:hypothetical protein